MRYHMLANVSIGFEPTLDSFAVLPIKSVHDACKARQHFTEELVTCHDHFVTGHAILRLVHLPLRHDLYCSLVGAYAIWGAAIAAVKVYKLSHRADDTGVIKQMAAWLVTLARVGLLGFLGLVVIPFMAGLWIDMVMLPLRSELTFVSACPF